MIRSTIAVFETDHLMKVNVKTIYLLFCFLVSSLLAGIRIYAENHG